MTLYDALKFSDNLQQNRTADASTLGHLELFSHDVLDLSDMMKKFMRKIDAPYFIKFAKIPLLICVLQSQPPSKLVLNHTPKDSHIPF